ncbi:MAG TPA: catalase family peroxidase [Solirubrobacteraceae bacterium]|nr:catalase family peroxidase [Solirubrobacteraceae bacterium]
MSITLTPQEAVDAANQVFGRHPGRRALHAKGILCRGTFTGTPAGGRLTRAAHMRGEPVPARIRVSNGSGNPDSPDYAPDVRGMAVKLELPDGTKTDIVAQSLPWFAFDQPRGFIEFMIAQRRGPSMAWRFPAYLIRHPHMIGALRVNLPALAPPESYATLPYYGVHAFRLTAADGSSRFVRYEWVPVAGDRRLSGREAKARGRDYLRQELRERLTEGPARFKLTLQIAEPGDPVDDPSKRWPAERERVEAGILEIVEIDEGGDENELVFDPANVADGIEMSDDPVLQFRPRAYSESASRRMQA